MRRMEFLAKKDGKWMPFSMESATKAKVAKEIWLSMEGKEIVAKFSKDGEVLVYIAGTEALRKYYEGKGLKAISFPTAVEQMVKQGSPFMDQEIYDNYNNLIRTFGPTPLILEDTRGEDGTSKAQIAG